MTGLQIMAAVGICADIGIVLAALLWPEPHEKRAPRSPRRTIRDRLAGHPCGPCPATPGYRPHQAGKGTPREFLGDRPATRSPTSGVDIRYPRSR
jgi:hypothetical protein